MADDEYVLCTTQSSWAQMAEQSYTSVLPAGRYMRPKILGDWPATASATQPGLDLRLMPRRLCEQDPTYRQLIPYVTLQPHYPDGRPVANTRLLYQRTAGAEKRLVDRFSLGVGGHVNIPDLIYYQEKAGTALPLSVRDCVCAAAARELFEELPEWMWAALPPLTPETCALVGIIDYHGDAVGSVHLGFHLHLRLGPELWDYLPDGLITEITLECGQARFAADEIVRAQHYDALEPWSQIVLDATVS